MSTKTYLEVPYAEREAAKKLGARWDPAAKKWYICESARGYKEAVSQYPDKPPILYLIGEVRPSGTPALSPDPTPITCKSLRSNIAPADWDRLRKFVRERAGNLCEYCAASGTLYVHDKYTYDTSTRTRKLVRLLAVCSDCREALGACRYPARNTGLSSAALGQLIKVNKWSVEQTNQAYKTALESLQDPVSCTLPWSDDFSILVGVVQVK